MKISELIIELQKVQEQYGDLECIARSHGNGSYVKKIFAVHQSLKIEDKRVDINNLCFLDDELL